MAAEDLIAVVFPDQLACAENLSGEREIPDHPLVRQTLYDSLHEAMDIDGLVALLLGMERGEIGVVTRELPRHRRWRRRSSPRARTPIWTMRRWKSGAPRQWLRGAGWIRRTPRSSGSSMRRQSSWCASRPGLAPRTPMNCTMR